MPIDPNIALGIQPIKIDNPIDSYGKALGLKQLMLQNQSGQQTFDDQQRLRGIYSTAGGSPEKLRELLWQGGFPEKAIAIDKDLQANRKGAADIQHTQGQIGEQQQKEAIQLAQGVLSLPPEQQGAGYQQMRQQAIAMGHEGARKLPEQWNPNMVQIFQAMVNGTLKPDQFMERKDYSNTVTPQAPGALVQPGQPAMPVTPQDSVDSASGAMVKPMQAAPALPATPIAQNAPPSPAEMTLPTEAVVANQLSPDTPLELRTRAKALRQQGTKAGKDVAQDLENEANRLEQRGLEEQRLKQQAEQAAENVRVREEGIKVRQANQGNQAKTNTAKLSDDFRQEPAVKDYRTIQPLVASMENAVSKNTAGSDLDMIYAVAKIFDPGSVVREGEMIMVKNAGGLPSVVQSALGFVVGGQRLSPALRQEILDQAHSRADNYKQAYDSVTKSYRDQAKRWELNPDDIVREYKITAKGVNAGRRATDQTPGWNDADEKRLQELERKRGAR